MRFAVVNNERVTATPKLKGLCPGCSEPVTARCGTQRVWHWAHDGKKNCDSWWETETEWHRNWKNDFPADWQEFIQHDQFGEKHIADIRSAHGLVIEFQHSRIDPQERIARERFYGNMVWVTDGARRKKDYERFLKSTNRFQRTNREGFFFVPAPDKCFPADWLESTVPVLFDFQGVAQANPPDGIRDVLWCLLPERKEGKAVVIGVSRKQFVEITHSRSQILPAPKIAPIPTHHVQMLSAYQQLVARQRMSMSRRRRRL